MSKIIYLAGGCFWGVEGYFRQLDGVKSTSVGYANSNIPNPSYEMVCYGLGNGVECVRVEFDENIINLDEILKRFFLIIDPTSKNKQGNDTGVQYRSGIYTQNKEMLESIKAFIQKIQKDYQKPILTEIFELQNYYLAEEYHQNYLEKNPNGYCHIDLSLAKKPI